MQKIVGRIVSVAVLIKKDKVIAVSNFVYIVRCRDNTLYTGWTTNLKRRLNEHNKEKGAKYTRGRTPVKLVYYEKLNSKSRALKREHEIKKMKKIQKEELVNNFNQELEVFNRR
ncbi:MAG: GIY-YIG nuclease family protein [Candidatus Mcinerneyibacterium aminivorans]|jgi:putative endonuclease|uniref:GIY-YIG nuclease family protein n=1 Tax=Candidatus Mcinerneyibacterium aminivorans TaxID=2703815 RepID=A0A5D0MEL2_9BACT|nr:MAG: GIY-YIG nuclease family protein [Candidatus Mcinerneyibacterium aminivorans]